jgi:glycine cleavage system H protein
VEAVKTVSDLMMPVTGEVLEVNEELDGAPELVNKEPFEGGWIIKISLQNPEEVDALMSAADYKEFIGK